jgi:hypothetical protein
MNRVENLGVNNPEELMASTQRDISSSQQERVIDVYVLPFADVLVLLQPSPVQLEVQAVTDQGTQNSDQQESPWERVVEAGL